MNRKTARASAMKLVYEWDMGGEGGDATIIDLLELTPGEKEYDYMKAIADGVAANSELIDETIVKFLGEGWTIDRVSKVDAAILRVAVYELKYTETEAKFVINEAVELAKQYSDDKSPAFVNGVLGNIQRNSENA